MSDTTRQELPVRLLPEAKCASLNRVPGSAEKLPNHDDFQTRAQFQKQP
jgi:hypothetical protein